MSEPALTLPEAAPYDPTTEPVSGQLQQALEIPEDGGSSADPEQQRPEEGEAQQRSGAQQQAMNLVEAAGLDFKSLAQEYAALGWLSEESYAKLASAGISKELVDDYIEGQQARAAAVRTEILATVPGGEQTVKAMTEWARFALTPAEQSAYNGAIQTSKENAILALAGLYAKYEKVNGRSPRLIEGEGSGGASGSVYKSIAEHVADCKDPRYAKDPNFRKAVADKLRRSRIY